MLQYYMTLDNWKKQLSWSTIFQAVLSGLGLLALLVTLVPYIDSKAEAYLRNHWWPFFIMAGIVGPAVWLIWQKRPVRSVYARLNSSDINIEIRVCDALQVGDAALIIPMNTTFDTNRQPMLRPVNSIQRQVIDRFFNGDTNAFGQMLKDQLIAAGYSETGSYPIGTTISLECNDRLFYAVASSKINLAGRAEVTWSELCSALTQLWKYIRDQGNKSTVVIPLIGTGRARGAIRREEVIVEIIQSFVLASGPKHFCEKLIIAVHPQDAPKINLPELGQLLKLYCKYAKPGPQN